MKSTLNIHWKDWCWNSNILATGWKNKLFGKDSCWETLKAGGEGRVGNRRWDDWMVSPTQWTWVWANSRRWWTTGKPWVLQSSGLQKFDITEQLNNKINNIYIYREKRNDCIFKILRISILDPILCSLRLPYHHTLGSDVHTNNIHCTGKHGGSAIYFWNRIIGTGNWSWFIITKSTYVSKYIFNAKLNTLIFRVTIWCLPHTFQIHFYCCIMDIIHHKDSTMGHWDYGLIWNLHTLTVYLFSSWLVGFIDSVL